MVMVGDSCLRGSELELLRLILYGSFFTFICYKIVLTFV